MTNWALGEQNSPRAHNIIDFLRNLGSEVNPVRELRFLTVCADPVRKEFSNGADGGFRPPSALRETAD